MQMLSNFLKFKDRFLEFVFPPRCIFCDEVVPAGQCVCKRCKESVSLSLCERILCDWGGESVVCISIFEYSGSVRDAIRRFKFSGQKHYAKYFADLAAEKLPNICEDIDVITAIPLSVLGLKKRGYNQAECFARSVAQNLSVNYEELLIKIKENFPQHELALSERVSNVKGVYKVSNIKNVKNKNILLCDDILTTGNTLKECAKMLKLFGANSVKCCTIACVQ